MHSLSLSLSHSRPPTRESLYPAPRSPIKQNLFRARWARVMQYPLACERPRKKALNILKTGLIKYSPHRSVHAMISAARWSFKTSARTSSIISPLRHLYVYVKLMCSVMHTRSVRTRVYYPRAIARRTHPCGCGAHQWYNRVTVVSARKRERAFLASKYVCTYLYSEWSAAGCSLYCVFMSSKER